jgi:hypothetical protein
MIVLPDVLESAAGKGRRLWLFIGRRGGRT